MDYIISAGYLCVISLVANSMWFLLLLVIPEKRFNGELKQVSKIMSISLLTHCMLLGLIVLAVIYMTYLKLGVLVRCLK